MCWLTSGAGRNRTRQFATASQLDPNYADALADVCGACGAGGQAGRSDRADSEGACASIRIRPVGTIGLLGLAHYAARQYEAAVETLRNDETYRTGSRRFLAASLAQLGRMDEARREGALFMASNPHFTIGRWAATQPFRDAATLQHFVDGYRKAGLAE